MGNPQDEASAEYSLGLDYAARGELGKAQEAFERALQLQPDHIEAQYDLGRLQARRGAWDEAVAAFKRLLELAPDFAQAHSELGLALVALGRPAEATKAFEAALQRKPDDPFAMTNLAVSLQERGEGRRACDLFEQAIGIAPWMEEAYQGLTGILVAAGNLAKAEAVLVAGEKAVRDAAKRARLQLSLGFLRAEQGYLDEAIHWFQTSLQTDPSSCDAKVALADALTEAQRYAGAAEALQAALEQDPRRADVHARLGSVFERLGLHAEALAAFELATAIDPECLKTEGPDWLASYERALTLSENSR